MVELAIRLERALKKASQKEFRRRNEQRFIFKSRTYDIDFTEVYRTRAVSLCNPSECNAGEDCCHKYKVDGINLCIGINTEFTLRHLDDGEKWGRIISDPCDESKAENIFTATREVLSVIGKAMK